ncbi:hypothetical protein EV196_102395 [Mariniflexile fucanivorans]|uniref:DUF2130 domain-containing protein n=2 Tax=Mariniflexile fucanivorans TaxID=264023 RepID=A0A4R1RPL9_9FLAO|nr:hypothetical protein EV196_102395 [Mariniflexile fucanivorans]
MNTQITCPKCNELIDVNDILTHQLEDAIRKEFLAKEVASKKALKAKEVQFVQEKEAFEAKKKQDVAHFQEVLNKKLKESLIAEEAKMKLKLQEENSEQFDILNKELNEKSEKLKELNKSKAEIEKLKREKDELKDSLSAQLQAELNLTLSQEKEKIKKASDEANELKIKEFEKKLADQKKLMEEMQRKHEQGSMQLQGEVQELAMEEWLAQNFPLDVIDEVKKGANGADCLQIVNTREQQNCGKIYYESKRTKAFQSAWIEKFKNDIREKKAHIGVLVTEVMPSDMERMGMRDGIWICTYEEFKGLSAVLRQSVIQISNAIVSQENRGDKMAMLYDFLTSNEFKLQIEGIVEGFTQMQNDLNSEKNSMKRIWTQREKQIEKVINNTVGMYGSIKGIAGNAVQSIKALELETEDQILIQ